MSRKRVVYMTRSIPTFGRGHQLLKEAVDLRVYGGEDGEFITRERYVKEVQENKPEAIFVHPPEKIDTEILDLAGPQLKVVATMSVGLEHIDLKECAKRHIAVGYVGDVLTDCVAEQTVALTLATARRYKEGFDAVHNGGWGTWDQGLWLAGKEIRGSTVGIVGFGRIGFATAKKLSSFGVAKFLYCGHTPKEYATEIEAEFVSFDDLLENSDFVIATCSINEQNKGLFDAQAFKKMKKSAIFINTSRGVLVNQDDLLEALKGGQIYAAGLDVTSPEPLPLNHPLIAQANCTVTPHIGSATQQTRLAMAELTARNIIAGLEGNALPCPVPL